MVRKRKEKPSLRMQRFLNQRASRRIFPRRVKTMTGIPEADREVVDQIQRTRFPAIDHEVNGVRNAAIEDLSAMEDESEYMDDAVVDAVPDEI